MLIKCEECGLQVSDKALACPHCGNPMKSSLPKPPRQPNKRRRLPNGFGQISEIKNRNLRNPYRAMITVGKTPEGRPICKPLKPESYFSTYNEAYEALVEYNRNPYDLNPGMTVHQLYDLWSEKHYAEVGSKSAIRSSVNAWKYCSSVYNMRVIDLRTRHIKACLENGVALVNNEPKTPTAVVKNHIKSLFNMMLDYAVEYELVDRNYSRGFTLSDDVIKEVTSVKKEHIAFTDEEMSLLWQHVYDKEFVDAIIVQCYSGWRPQEIAELKLENIDLENWAFTGGMKTESGIDRTVPIHSKIRDLVTWKYKQATDLGSEYLFNCQKYHRKDSGTRFTYEKFLTGFNNLKEELKLNPEHRPHDGRKHFVTQAKKYGVDEYAIKYMVGHKISDLTEKVYTKREFEWLQTELEKIK